MKRMIYILSHLAILTCALIMNQACQEDYEMVDPL